MDNKFFKGVNSFATIAEIETGMERKDYYNNTILDVFCVKEYKLKEFFCKPYEMDITLDSFVNYYFPEFSYTFSALDQDKFLLKKIIFTIMIDYQPSHLVPSNHQRTISGIITDFDYEYMYDRKKNIDYSVIKLKVKPLISAMDFVQNNFIFTNTEDATKGTTIAEIFATLFKKYEINPQYKYSNSNVKNTQIPFKIQYQETDLDFFIRLCQENNLYFYLSYATNGDETLIIADSTTPSNLMSIQGEDKAFDVLYSAEDFTRENSFQQMMYPVFKSGLNIKNIEPHLQWPLLWPKGHIVLQSSYSRKMLFPGNLISLNSSESPGEAPTDMLVVSSTTTSIVNSNKEQCLSHEILFYPFSTGICLLAQIQKPRLYGIQYGLVVGQSNTAETSSVNDTTLKGGTVTVNLYLEQWPLGSRVYAFPPIPSPPVSINIPVAQPFGGQSGQNGYCGVWMMPRVGQVVMIDFYNGDPDQPVITGTVYNAQNTNNSWVPGGKNLIPTYTTYDASANPVATQLTSAQFAMVTCTTPSGKTGNVILLDDKADETAPQIYMSTNGNSSFVSLNNSSVTVLKGNYVTQVGTGEGTSTMTFDNKGNLTVNVPGNMSFTAGKDMSFTCQNLNVTTNKNANMTATQNVNISATQNLNISATQNLNISASQNVNMNSTMGSTIKSGTTMDVEGGTSSNFNGTTSVAVGALQVNITGKATVAVAAPKADFTADAIATLKGAMTMLGGG